MISNASLFRRLLKRRQFHAACGVFLSEIWEASRLLSGDVADLTEEDRGLRWDDLVDRQRMLSGMWEKLFDQSHDNSLFLIAGAIRKQTMFSAAHKEYFREVADSYSDGFLDDIELINGRQADAGKWFNCFL